MLYRFFITYGIKPVRGGQPPAHKTIEVFPSGSFGLKFERPDEFCADFRRNWNGSLTLKDKDYQLLKGLETTDKYSPVMLIVKKRKVNIWSEFWRGQFSPYNCDWDNDRCIVSFNPTVLDEYSTLLDGFELEKNFFECQVADPFTASTVTNIETVVHTQNISAFIQDVQDMVDLWNRPQYTLRENYFNGKFFEPRCARPNFPLMPVFLAKPSFPDQYTQNDGWVIKKMSYNSVTGIEMTLGRMVVYTLDNAGVPVPPISGTWYQSDAVQFAGIDAHKWIRLGTETALLFDNDFVLSVTTQNNITYTYSRIQSNVSTTHTRGRWVYDVLQMYLDDYQLTLKSKFFTDTVNPVTGEVGNPTKYLQMVEKSDFKTPTSSEPASLEKYKFSEFISDLCNTFNLLWKIENDSFVIENVTYFPENQLLDLTQLDSGKWVKHLNKYNYIANEKPSKETWSFAEKTDDLDFAGVPVEYATINTSGKSKDSTTTHQIGNLFTDINSLKLSQSSYSNSGFVLVSLRWDGTRWNVNEDTGILTGFIKLNGYLSTSSLLDKFWKFERPLPTGLMNGIMTTFTAQKQRRQVQISFPLDDNEYTPYSNIKTYLGWGRVADLELDMKTNTYKTTLEYD